MILEGVLENVVKSYKPLPQLEVLLAALTIQRRSLFVGEENKNFVAYFSCEMRCILLGGTNNILLQKAE